MNSPGCRKLVIATATLALGITSAYQIGDVRSEEHLQPEDSMFSEHYRHSYHERIRTVFEEAFMRNVRARVVVLPSFENDYAIGVREDIDKYKIFMLRLVEPTKLSTEPGPPKNQSRIVGNAQQDSMATPPKLPRNFEYLTLPKTVRHTTVVRCEVEIDETLAKRLIDIWRTALLATRYKIRTNLGLDGVSYHFSMAIKYEELAGQTWSPEAETNSGRLVAITEAMAALCTEPTKSLMVELAELAKSLQLRWSGSWSDWLSSVTGK